MQDRLDALKEKIKLAFAGVPPPAAGRITGVVYDDKEALEIREYFEGEDWRSIDDDILVQNYERLPLLTPEALHYFLPAFMLYALEHFEWNFLVTEFTAYCLLPGNVTSRSHIRWEEERYGIFDEDQIAVMLEYLDLVEENGEIVTEPNLLKRGRERFKKYWKAGRKLYELDPK